MFAPVAELVTGGQLSGQEAQRVKPEDPDDHIQEGKDGGQSGGVADYSCICHKF